MNHYRTEEIWFQRDGMKIFGMSYIPTGIQNKYPTVIIGHGFTGTYRDNMNYAEILAMNGFVVYLMDFCGGSNYTRSDGSTFEMSILTEKADMLAVVNQLKDMYFVDQNHIYLMGESQGAFVAAIAAAELREQIKGSVLLYPAFVIQDTGKETYQKKENVRPSSLWGVNLGKCYFQDIWDLDIYKEISQYTGPVLLFHGTKDNLVPVEYSMRADSSYLNSELIIVKGGGHGFSGHHAKQVADKIVWFLNRQEQGEK